jgi:UDP-GlcNAc:undecaprenyl-phosphate GlcNAc-1-phosphate transferase
VILFAELLATFVVALGASMGVLPLVLRAATRKALLDLPDGTRRVHPRAVPRLGGIAVFAGLLAAVLLWQTTSAFGVRMSSTMIALILAGGVLFAIGLIDDLRGVPPAGKLLAQGAAALLVYAAGFRLNLLHFPPDITVELGWLSLPLTVLWLVGVSNAFNLIDGIDGLAGGVGIIALAAATITALVVGNQTVPWFAIALMGALFGFLRYNMPPARIFLGDSGSLVVGFLLAVLSVRAGMQGDGSVAVLAPVFALSYPLLDTGIAILRRWLRGVPLSRGDGRHIH